MTIKNFAEQLSEALLAVADAKVVEKADTHHGRHAVLMIWEGDDEPR